MNDDITAAIVVFGIMFAITVIGFLRSSANAERLNASTHSTDLPMSGNNRSRLGTPVRG